jgi:hypothetical protein
VRFRENEHLHESGHDTGLPVVIKALVDGENLSLSIYIYP